MECKRYSSSGDNPDRQRTKVAARVLLPFMVTKPAGMRTQIPRIHYRLATENQCRVHDPDLEFAGLRGKLAA